MGHTYCGGATVAQPLGGGLDGTDPPEMGVPALLVTGLMGITSDVTPYEIVGCNDFRWLPQLERDKLVAEWCRLVGKESQVAQIAPSRPQYEKRGEREVARQLGLDRDDVRRAFKVASLTPEAQQAAHDVGLADNRAALLEAASGGQALSLPGKLFHAKMSNTIAALKIMCTWSVL